MTPVSRVAFVSHPSSSKQRYLAVMIVYLDAGGSVTDRDVFSIGCLVATEKQWNNFESSWRKLLRRYKFFKVRKGKRYEYFHMTDFERGCPPFNSLSEGQHDFRLAQLCSIIKKNIRLGFSMSIDATEWRALVKPHIASKYEQARAHYIYLFQHCMDHIAVQIEKGKLVLPRNDLIAVICDQENVEGAAKEHFFRLKHKRGWSRIFAGIGFQDNLQFIPLQAADLIAYEGYKQMEHTIQKRKPRKSFLDLQASPRIKFYYYDIAEFVAFLEMENWLIDED